ncbi:uncharacterized protein LOC132056388 isoform X1 [Lycium ferocissimum]|uniref:uncharacterized protein LOC132056388 isoform X1 n=1 Tax=Lycium ferocissimum TaxID=112874 RepID=UPI0028149DFF|nr:uncharacterized protein LOC132056388 isoform X1 [Lycium ferocissimum]
MYLKAPFWSKDSNTESQTESPSAVTELISSLEKQRLYREVTLALRSGLSDARAEFSFLRIRGLRVILKFLRSVAESDTTINLFCHSQSIPDLQEPMILGYSSVLMAERQKNRDSGGGPYQLEQQIQAFIDTSNRRMQHMEKWKQHLSWTSHSSPCQYEVQRCYNEQQILAEQCAYHPNLIPALYGVEYCGADFSTHPNTYGFECISATMGISRDSKHQKCATDGKRNAWRKKHKYELRRQPANTKLSSNKIVRRVRVGGGNAKWSAIVQIGATAEEIQRGNTLMDVEDEHDESSEIKEDQVFDNCPHPEAIANQLASSSTEKKLEPDADKVFDISPQQNEIDVDELQSVKRDEEEEETLMRLESGNPEEEKLENNEYQVLDQILQMYGINITDIHWDDSVGDEPIELEYSERKSEIKEYQVFDISSLKDDAEVLDDEQLQAAGFSLVNPISLSLNMVSNDMV